MIKLSFQYSKRGLVSAALFTSMAVAAFVWLYFVALQNPADSGESAVLMLIFALPWVMFIPIDWMGPYWGIACVFLNIVLIYLVSGGMKISRRHQGSKRQIKHVK